MGILEAELTKAYEDVSTETNEKKIDYLMKQIGKLQQKLEYYEVYNAENILLRIVDGMNIDSNLLDNISFVSALRCRRVYRFEI